MTQKTRIVSAAVATAAILFTLGQLGGEPVPEPPVQVAGWRAEVRLTNAPGTSETTYNFARCIATDAAGGVHVAWFDARDGAPQAYYRRSADGGTSWGPEQRLSDLALGNVHPALAVAGTHVYFVWHDTRFRVHFRRSLDGGASWQEEVVLAGGPAGAAHASVAASGDRVYVVWGDERDGQTEMYLRRSLDGGATWEAERRMTDTPWVSWVPTVAVSGDDVLVGWVDARDGNEEEYVKHSADGGATWGPDLRLTEHAANSWAPSIAGAGKTVWFAWFDQRDAAAQPADAERKLDEVLRMLGQPVEPAPAAAVMVPDGDEIARVRAERKLRLVEKSAPAWAESGGDVARLQAVMAELQRMMPSPEGLRAAEAKLDQALRLVGLDLPEDSGAGGDDPAAAFGARIQPKMQRLQARIPGWVAGGGDQARVLGIVKEFEYLLHDNGGKSHLAKEAKIDEALAVLGLKDDGPAPTAVRMVTAIDEQMARMRRKFALVGGAGPDWVRAGGDPRLLETKLRDVEATMQTAMHEWDLYVRRSDDGGATWGPEARLTSAPGLSQRPSIAVNGATVRVAWFDGRDGNVEVYFRESRDGGRTWGEDVRLTHAAGDSMFASLALSGETAHVVWCDRRGGDAEIYYRRTER